MRLQGSNGTARGSVAVLVASLTALAAAAIPVAAAGASQAVPARAVATARHSGAAGHAKLTTVRLVYDWPGIDFEAVPFTVGNARGYYQKLGIKVDVVIPPTTSTTVKMLAVGKGDIGFDTTTDVVFAQAQGIDVKSIGNYSQDNNWGLVAPPGKPIDLKHLKGKSIGIFTDSWTEAMMPYVLRAAGLSAGEISTPIFTSDDIAPLLAGKIDLATNTLNYAVAEVQGATGKKPTTLLATKFGAPNVPVWVFTATSSWLKTHGSVARAFMTATRQAFAWSIAHPGAAVEDFVAAYPKNGSSEQYNLNGWRATIPVLGTTSTLLSQRAAEWTEVAGALKAVKLLSKALPASSYFTNAYN